MRIETHEYRTIIADEGYFLTNNQGLYGYEIVLGEFDSPENYVELPVSEWPSIPEPEEPETPDVPTGSEEQEISEIQEFDSLYIAKRFKIMEIEAYDVSTNVNGFFYSGNFMWLDRETRSSLKNTIESLALMNRDSLNIWYEDIYVTVDLNSARQLLAALEVYATDCYNVTALHKAEVNSMTSVSDVENFDVTVGYPQRLEF